MLLLLVTLIALVALVVDPDACPEPWPLFECDDPTFKSSQFIPKLDTADELQVAEELPWPLDPLHLLRIRASPARLRDFIHDQGSAEKQPYIVSDFEPSLAKEFSGSMRFNALISEICKKKFTL